MNGSKIKTRLMKANDFEAVVRIDEKILKVSRRQAYKLKFEKLVTAKDNVPTSLVAEDENGTVVGFVMGELFIGEYGDLQERAALDTIGVDPDYRHKGIGKQLIKEYFDHLKTLGVRRLHTLVRWNDAELIRFFGENKFSPSEIINLDRSI
ncbi:MAG: GNAT family N-acetyltransferase [Spirochaetes bacterium]|nr:GNAT family N-acetyltransferase [Spirochaetota bacterium]